jgi:hypothetical protein
MDSSWGVPEQYDTGPPVPTISLMVVTPTAFSIKLDVLPHVVEMQTLRDLTQ